MKVIIPVAGVGSRLKPHTFSTPKPLMDVAGKAMISYILDEVVKLKPEEIVFVVGYKRKDIEEFVHGYLKDENVRFVLQETRNGDGGAIHLALKELNGIYDDDEVLIIFGDTLIDFDVRKELKDLQDYDGAVFAKQVKNPEAYGVLYTKDDIIYDVVEKPEKSESDLAIIGAYWFKSFKQLSLIFDEIFEKNITEKGEYRIATAVRLLADDPLGKNRLKAVPVVEWFDCGRPEVLLEANRYFLGKSTSGGAKQKGEGLIIGPAFVAKSAQVTKSIIGPNTSIARDVVVENSIIENSIIAKGAIIKNVVLKDSIVGAYVHLKGNIKKLNVGEKSVMIFE